MCGIVGFANLKQNLNTENYKHILLSINKKISINNQTKDTFFTREHVCLGYKSLAELDSKSTKQPISCELNGNNYTLVFSGQVYNKEDLKKELLENGFVFEDNSDAEILLKSYIYLGYDIVHKLNGIFALSIWDENKQELFIARDHFGVKSLYYTITENNFIFASQIKCLFEFPRRRS